MVLAGTWTLLAWPWIAAFALVLAAMKFPAHSLLRFWELPLYTSPVLPVALVLGLSCLLFPGSSGNNRRFEASRRQL
jgi:hypothetical protein